MMIFSWKKTWFSRFVFVFLHSLKGIILAMPAESCPTDRLGVTDIKTPRLVKICTSWPVMLLTAWLGINAWSWDMIREAVLTQDAHSSSTFLV